MADRRWRTEFETRQKLCSSFDPAFWIDNLPHDSQDGDIIEVFLQNLGGSGTCSSCKTMLQTFCGDVDLCRLLSGPHDLKKTALLTEGAFHGSQWCSRPDDGPLDARQLYGLLAKPRFGSDGCNCDAAPLTSTITEIEDTNTDLDIARATRTGPDAERRIIYITDVDKWSVLALIATVSYNQAEPLRKALYQHLASEAYIGMTNTKAWLMFEIAFHLPFWALRTVQRGQEPHRKGRDVSFLDDTGRKIQYIYPASYSCVVVGTDQWNYLAYCFIDTYFDESDSRRESAEGHHEMRNEGGGLPLDPCGDNTFITEYLAANPRCWFLAVLEVRLGKVVKEGSIIVLELRRSLTKMREVCSRVTGDTCMRPNLAHSTDIPIIDLPFSNKHPET